MYAELINKLKVCTDRKDNGYLDNAKFVPTCNKSSVKVFLFDCGLNVIGVMHQPNKIILQDSQIWKI